MSHESDPGQLVRAQIDRALREAAVQPDVDAVFRRADALGEHALDGLDDEHRLAPFVAAYREQLDRAVGEIEADPQAVPEAVLSTAAWWTRWGALAVAAAVVLAIGAAVLIGSPGLLGRGDGGRELHDAQHHAQESDDGGQARVVEPPKPTPAPVVRRSPTTTPAPAVEPAAEEAPAAEAVPAEPPPPAPPEAKSASRSRADRLAALDARAQAAWQRGALAEAERHYRQLIKQGGRRPIAELAYGELFALVRQRGGNLAPLWRGYLRRFPSGRYAEDVRAGLCRRASAEQREACWAEYRRLHPNGIHAP